MRRFVSAVCCSFACATLLLATAVSGQEVRPNDPANQWNLEHLFPSVDAWNRVKQVKVGSAWVLRQGTELVALSTVCPHLGCGVDFEATSNKFYCPCHKSYFTLDGAVESGPSPRGLDRLELQQAEQLVSIRYVRYKTGVEAKEPIA